MSPNSSSDDDLDQGVMPEVVLMSENPARFHKPEGRAGDCVSVEVDMIHGGAPFRVRVDGERIPTPDSWQIAAIDSGNAASGFELQVVYNTPSGPDTDSYGPLAGSLVRTFALAYPGENG